MRCNICGKTAGHGHNISHSKRHTRRRWLPNIHPATIAIQGKLTRLNVCTRCLRTQQKVTA